MIKEIYKSVRIGSSDGYPGSFSHICNLRENRRDLLSESFGIMDYNNSKLDEIIKKGTDENKSIYQIKIETGGNNRSALTADNWKL